MAAQKIKFPTIAPGTTNAGQTLSVTSASSATEAVLALSNSVTGVTAALPLVAAQDGNGVVALAVQDGSMNVSKITKGSPGQVLMSGLSASQWISTVPLTSGGTGTSDPLLGVLVGQGAQPITAIPIGTQGQVLQVNSSGSVAFSSVALPAPIDSYYVTTKADSVLTNEQNLGALASGLLKSTVAANASTLSIAVSGTDFYGPTQPSPIPLTKGGTGISSLPSNSILVTPSGGNAIATLSPSSSGQVLYSNAGTPSFGNLSNLAGTLGISQGGTGSTTYTNNSLVASNGSGNALVSVFNGTTGQVLAINGSGIPAFQDLSGSLPNIPVSKGGTGTTSLTANSLILGNGTAAVTSIANGASGTILQMSTDSTPVPVFGSLSLSAFSGLLGVAQGGTGSSSFTSGSLLTGSGSSSIGEVEIGSPGQYLVVNGDGDGLEFDNLSVTAGDLDGVVSVENGGTGVASLTQNGVLIGNNADDVLVTDAGSANQVLMANASGAPSFKNIPVQIIPPTAVGQIAVTTTLAGATTWTYLSAPSVVATGNKWYLIVTQNASGGMDLSWEASA